MNMTKKQMKSNTMIPKIIAGLAGNLLDMSKSNVKLQGLPQQIMRCAAQGVSINAQRTLKPRHNKKNWSLSVPKPENLKQLLQQVVEALQKPVPRTFRSQSSNPYILRTDASNLGWGGVLLRKGSGPRLSKEVDFCQGPWSKREERWHITRKEAMATRYALESLHTHLKKGDYLILETDAMATKYGWLKGSKRESMNSVIEPIHTMMNQKGVYVEARFIPGKENKRADWLSRNPDPKNYQLQRSLFRKVTNLFQYFPEIDLFANKRNKQVEKYCSWSKEPESQGNAFNRSWEKTKNWINPPWELVERVLKKIKEDKASALMCLPVCCTKN